MIAKTDWIDIFHSDRLNRRDARKNQCSSCVVVVLNTSKTKTKPLVILERTGSIAGDKAGIAIRKHSAKRVPTPPDITMAKFNNPF
jgi:hypothetical protein